MTQHGFKLVREQSVPALNLMVQEFTHPSGASHFHLASEHQENVFMVAFRTVPHDSTGVAHILEHTVLCGSEKFPVRDPFFSMIRRSLNTFMNAFTTSDYTAYPFASQSRKDYYNLMEVYLDAVFFSRLDPLDFKQEGHRLEFEVMDDTSSPLTYKGVVFNEMKGDTSSPVSMLYQAIQEKLYPTTTYHYNSGGDPENIPELSYDGLMDFYRSHYHPANAIFMTFGNIPASEQQEKIADLALSKLDLPDIEPIRVKAEQRYTNPISHEESYPVDDDDVSGKTHIVLSWLMGRNIDLEMMLKCHLLSDVLLDTSASPLRQALETWEHSTGVSPMSGFEEDHMEMNFMCGVEGSDPEHADALESLVLGVLNDVATRGIEKDRLEAVLHQLELSQREIGGDGAPYGLQLIFSCMSAAVHGGDPIGLLDLDPVVEKLRADIEDPEFIKGLVKELLLDNTHRVRTVMKPDRQLADRLIEAERNKLEVERSRLSPADCQQIVDQSLALAARQDEPDELDVLPEVTREDIPAARGFVQPVKAVKISSAPAISLVGEQAGTNGLVYHQVITRLPAIPAELQGLLPVISQLVTEVGSAGRGYLDTQHMQHSFTGGISAFSTFRTEISDTEQFSGYFTTSSRTLAHKSGEMIRLMRETLEAPRFDESERINDLVQQLAMRRVNGIAGSGHQYAMTAAAANIRPLTAFSNFLTGMPGILRLKRLADDMKNGSGQAQLTEQLTALHDLLVATEKQLLVIADSDHLDGVLGEAKQCWEDAAVHSNESMFDASSIEMPSLRDQAFVVPTQVNYCATAYPTVPESHVDAAALTVLAAILRNHFLHSALREKGGAYGGGATHDSGNGVFRFYSYRDPGIGKTFDAFQQALEWSRQGNINEDMVQEALLGVIGSIDAPGSPAGEVRQAHHHGLFGRDAGYREARRRAILDVDVQQLNAVAHTYFNTQPSRALVTSEGRLPEVDNGFEIVRIGESQ